MTAPYKQPVLCQHVDDRTIFHVEDIDVQVPGGELFARRWTPQARDSDVPIVLLHDSLGCVEMWRNFPGELAVSCGRPVIAYDRLGFGGSSARLEIPSVRFVREEADIYFPLLFDALGLTPFVLLGHSVGGAMALQVAANYKEQCQGVIPIAAQPYVERRTLDSIRNAKEAFQEPNQLAKLKKWHGEKADWVVSAWTDVWLDPEFENWSIISNLPSVKCPALVLHGDRDEYGSSAFPETITEHVKGEVKMVILDECGHVPHREYPARVVSLVHDFLKS